MKSSETAFTSYNKNSVISLRRKSEDAENTEIADTERLQLL